MDETKGSFMKLRIRPNLVHLPLLAIIAMIPVLYLAKGYYLFDLVLTALIAVFAICYSVDSVKCRSRYSFVLTVSCMLRLCLMYYDIYTSDPLGLPFLGDYESSDCWWFFDNAVLYSIGDSGAGGGTFSAVIGTVFMVTGPSRLMGQFVVVLFSLGTIHIVLGNLEYLHLETKKIEVGLYFMCLSPHYLLLSVVLLRESVITFFVALSIGRMLRWIAGEGEAHFLAACIFALIASLFHGGSGALLAGYVFLRFLYSTKEHEFAFSIQNVVYGSIASIILVAFFLNYGNTFFSKLTDAGSIEQLSEGISRGGSSYAQYVGNAANPFNMVVYTPLRVIYFLFSPFPWQWRSVIDVFSALMSSVPLFYILQSSIRYILDCVDKARRNVVLSIIIAISPVIFVFAWGVANTGTALRHRDKLIAASALILSIVWREKKGGSDASRVVIDSTSTTKEGKTR